MTYIHPDDSPDHLATPAEAMKEYAENFGRDNPDKAWILTPWDVWEANPFYTGPAVPHPEDYSPEDDIERARR